MPTVIYSRSPNDQQSSTANPTVVYTVTNSPTTNSPPLILPVGTNSYAATTNTSNVATILDIPPAGTDPNSPVGQEYAFNLADIIISNSSSGVISAFYQNSNNVNQFTAIPYNATNVVGGVTNKYYSFATNTSFYDYRESKTVKAVQLNVGAFNSWLSGAGATYNNQNNSGSTSKGHSINSVYIYNNAPSSSTQLPAVRAANGGTLPSAGLTVATPDPIYVLGNYNANGVSLNNGTNVVTAAARRLYGRFHHDSLLKLERQLYLEHGSHFAKRRQHHRQCRDPGRYCAISHRQWHKTLQRRRGKFPPPVGKLEQWER